MSSGDTRNNNPAYQNLRADRLFLFVLRKEETQREAHAQVHHIEELPCQVGGLVHTHNIATEQDRCAQAQGRPNEEAPTQALPDQ